MIVWRIANERYADLSGVGGLHVAGRWHSQDAPVCYFAEHPALAMLEVRVHMDLEVAFMTNYVMLKVQIADSIEMSEIEQRPVDESTCQQLGDGWLAELRTAVCRVRSVLYPESYNYLLNPLHVDAKQVKIVDTKPLVFDERLFR